MCNALNTKEKVMIWLQTPVARQGHSVHLYYVDDLTTDASGKTRSFSALILCTDKCFIATVRSMWINQWLSYLKCFKRNMAMVCVSNSNN